MRKNFLLFAIAGLGLLISACGDTGGGDGGASPVVARYAFVANGGDNSVSSYVVESATGLLKWISQTEAGMIPVSVTVDPSGQYAYVANDNSDGISQYAIGADGRLTLMTTAILGDESGPFSVTTVGTRQ